MSNKKFVRTEKSGGKGKTVFKLFLLLVLLAADIAVCSTIYLNSKVEIISKAQYELKVPQGDLSDLFGNFDDYDYGPVEVYVPTYDTSTTEDTENAKEDPIINIMVVGQDYRPEDEDGDGKLADTIMLFSLNKDTHKLTITSFLRDSYVQLPRHFRGLQCGKNRINASYALGYALFGDLGAMEMLDVTILENYGVRIDGNVEITFETFPKVIDALGGVEIYLEGDELNYMNTLIDGYNETLGWSLKRCVEGENLLDGWPALMYARMRHSGPADNDVYRANRQRNLVTKLIDKLKTMSVFQLNSLLDEILPMILTDLSNDQIRTYIAEAIPCILDMEIVSNQCPAEGTYGFIQIDIAGVPSSVLNINFEQNADLLRAICEP